VRRSSLQVPKDSCGMIQFEFVHERLADLAEDGDGLTPTTASPGSTPTQAMHDTGRCPPSEPAVPSHPRPGQSLTSVHPRVRPDPRLADCWVGMCSRRKRAPRAW
jgi:hypothetical protein